MLAFVMTMPPSRSERRDDKIDGYILRIAKGDSGALALLYEETHTAVYGFALSILKNKHNAEDVAHDAFIQVWKAAGSYTPEGKPFAWIFTITRNLAHMRLREQTRIVEISPEHWQKMFAGTPAMDAADHLVLEALMGSLSDEERQIIMLHTMAGLKHREIADVLNLRLSTVLSKYNRALKKLRNALKEAE